MKKSKFLSHPGLLLSLEQIEQAGLCGGEHIALGMSQLYPPACGLKVLSAFLYPDEVETKQDLRVLAGLHSWMRRSGNIEFDGLLQLSGMGPDTGERDAHLQGVGCDADGE